MLTIPLLDVPLHAQGSDEGAFLPSLPSLDLVSSCLLFALLHGQHADVLRRLVQVPGTTRSASRTGRVPSRPRSSLTLGD